MTHVHTTCLHVKCCNNITSHQGLTNQAETPGHVYPLRSLRAIFNNLLHGIVEVFIAQAQEVHRKLVPDFPITLDSTQ